MKLAFCVENETDELVLAAIVERVLDRSVIRDATRYRLPKRGFGNALKLAFSVARNAFYFGLDGAVFAIDNDGAPLHEDGHTPTIRSACRLCRLRAHADVDALQWRTRHPHPPIRYLFAIPVQTIETWLLLMRGERFQKDAAKIGADPSGRRELKRRLYGVEDPDGETMRTTASVALERFNPESLAAQSPSFRDFFDQLVAIKSATT